MRSAVSAPTTKVTPGSRCAFSRNVAARVSSTVCRQANCARRCRTSAALALLEYDRDDVDALGVRDRDVAPMVALLRAVAHQARRDADAHESRLVGSSTAPGERPARHRDRGLGAAGLLGLPAEQLD